MIMDAQVDLIMFLAIWALIIEASLVTLFVIFAYFVKLYLLLRKKYRSQEVEKLRKLLHDLLQSQKEIPHKNIKRLRRSILNTLMLLNEFDNQYKQAPYWLNLREQLIREVIHYKAKRFARSKNRFHKYLASRCFYYGIEKSDEELIENLVKDPAILVALNASRVAFKFPTSRLINSIISHCSQGRRLQQSVFANSIVEDVTSYRILISIIEQKLNSEKDPYVKIFCYHLLIHLPCEEERGVKSAMSDLEDNNLDLKLIVLNYLAHLNQEKAIALIAQCIHDQHWQVRVRAINLLGKLKCEKWAAAIGDRLKDSQWWVRLRAAQALGELGETGFKILESQDPEVDRYAYEAAQQVLISLQKARELRKHETKKHEI